MVQSAFAHTRVHVHTCINENLSRGTTCACVFVSAKMCICCVCVMKKLSHCPVCVGRVMPVLKCVHIVVVFVFV